MKKRLRRTSARYLALLAGASGLTRGLRRRRKSAGDFRVFILEYHDISPDGHECEGTVSHTRFERHARHLKKLYEVQTVRQAAESLQPGAVLNHDLLVLTFDDGYLGNYEAAWPVLQKLGLSATVYLTTGFLDGEELWFDFARRALKEVGAIGSTQDKNLQECLEIAFGGGLVNTDVDSMVERLKYSKPGDREKVLGCLRRHASRVAEPARPMSWDQVREMSRSGIEMACHTVTHPILSTLERVDQETEILKSRQRVSEEIGESPTTFAYPNGSRRDYDASTLEILRRSDFAAACTTRKGSNRVGCDPLTLRRLGVGSDSLPVLEARLAGLFDEEMRRFMRIS